MRSRHGFLLVAQAIVMFATRIGLGATQAAATTDEVRNTLARKDCIRGQFANDNRGDPFPDHRGRVFRLGQNDPDRLPPTEKRPWRTIDVKDGAPVDPRAYLQALLDYGLEGNIDVEDNKVRRWYGMPWMDWNTSGWAAHRCAIRRLALSLTHKDEHITP